MATTKNINIPIQTRLKVWERENKQCFYCGSKVKFEDLTIDHVKARSRGGKDHESNYVCCCKDCNKIKANMSVEEFNNVINNLHNLLRNESKFMLLLKHFNVKITRKTSFVEKANLIIQNQKV